MYVRKIGGHLQNYTVCTAHSTAIRKVSIFKNLKNFRLCVLCIFLLLPFLHCTFLTSPRLARQDCEQLLFSIFKPHCPAGIPIPSLPNPSSSGLAKTFLYHHLENQIPGYFFLGPFIPNLILFVTLWCRRRYFPHPTQWRYLLHHVTCVTYLGMGGTLLCLSVKQFAGKTPAKISSFQERRVGKINSACQDSIQPTAQRK